MRSASRDLIGIRAIAGLDAEKLPDDCVMAKQRGRLGSVVASFNLGTDVRTRSDMLDGGGGNGIDEGQVVHLLKDLQQHQQCQSRGLPTRVAVHLLKIFNVRRVASLQLRSRNDLGEARIRGAFDGGHTGFSNSNGPANVAQKTAKPSHYCRYMRCHTGPRSD